MQLLKMTLQKKLMHISDQKGKNLNINQFSENKRNTFHLSKKGMQNPLIKKNEENELDME